MKAKLSIPLVSILLLSFIWLGVANIRHSNNKLQMQKIELKSSEAKLKQLNIQYENVLNSKAQTEQEKQQQLEKIKQLEQEKNNLSSQLQAKLTKQQNKIAEASNKAIGISTVSAQANCNTGNPYKDYIYMKESGCNPSSVNSIGCRGIGQACPGTKLPCGADFNCQDKYFEQYAISRYGSWENAYRFWLNNHWW